MKQHPKN